MPYWKLGVTHCKGSLFLFMSASPLHSRAAPPSHGGEWVALSPSLWHRILLYTRAVRVPAITSRGARHRREQTEPPSVPAGRRRGQRRRGSWACTSFLEPAVWALEGKKTEIACTNTTLMPSNNMTQGKTWISWQAATLRHRWGEARQREVASNCQPRHPVRTAHHPAAGLCGVTAPHSLPCTFWLDIFRHN